MDRQLTIEFPWLSLRNIPSGPGLYRYALNPPTDVRAISGDTIWVAEAKLDLSGYVQSDLTVGFRRSFEQKGGTEFIEWKTSYDPSTEYAIETILVSSVPFNDNQLFAACVGSPGFTNYVDAGIDWGNFNREHIIHGSYKIHYPNSVVGSSAFNGSGAATLVPLQDNYFSSLEPTAADCLYCYRVIIAPDHGASLSEGIQKLFFPPVRVILDAFTVEEPTLEYMMRLKRSYELANQV